jgi:hypothetical protein
MKQRFLKTHGAGFLALIAALAVSGTGLLMAEDVAVNSPASPTVPAAATPTDATTTSLSPPTREVVKMSVSGVSEEVVKAYVYHSPAGFNLTADSIIHLKAVGVTPDVLAAMINRDTALRDQAALNMRSKLPPQTAQPNYVQQPPSPGNPGDEATAPAPDYSAQTYPAYPDSTYYYPNYAYDYPVDNYYYPYYPYGYYGGYYFVGGRWFLNPHFRFGGRGFIGAPFSHGFIGSPFGFGRGRSFGGGGFHTFGGGGHFSHGGGGFSGGHGGGGHR